MFEEKKITPVDLGTQLYHDMLSKYDLSKIKKIKERING